MQLLFSTLFLAMLAGPAFAELPAAHRYALIIGNNTAGPGQSALRFAEQDAAAFARILTELGGHRADRIRVLNSPSRTTVKQALAGMTDALQYHATRGEQTIFTFYYSGHARAEGLDFGDESIALPQLRARLDALPTAVTLVVLDACRSGAFSRAKGATPVEDFSINAVRQLDARGMAVLTSSSATELSQESASIGGSFFTHHLLVGLRGAAERNYDGRISLKEAYDYAYNQTLLSTARTALGKQHVRFETRLVGHGDLPLTTPAAGQAHLSFSAGLVGDIVVATQAQQPTVVAELHKVAGHAARIAVPPGGYRALIRQKNRMGQCDFTVAPGAVTELNGRECTYGPLVARADPKGVAARSSLEPLDTGWTLELGVGGQSRNTSPYIDRLKGFGYEQQFDLFEAETSIRFGKRITSHLTTLIGWRTLDDARWRLDDGDAAQEHEYTGEAFEGLLRASMLGLSDFVGIYGQLGLGVAHVHDTLSGAPAQSHWGPMLSLGAGIQILPRSLVGAYLEGTYTVAPTLENRLGDTHDVGGFGAMFGLRVTP